MSRAEKRQRKKENTRAAREARARQMQREKRKRTALRVGAAVVLGVLGIVIVTLLSGDGDDDVAVTDTTAVPSESTSTTIAVSAPDFELDPTIDYSARITTNFGEIVVDLDEGAAPVATGHFVRLARDGFYDGLTWHRAAADFVIQGGDPSGDGTGGSGSSVVGEVPEDSYPIGSLAAAKTQTDPPGTFDAQFFIVTGTRGATLPNDFARLGTVASGLEVAQEIERLAPPEGDGPPVETATIDRVEVIETPAQ